MGDTTAVYTGTAVGYQLRIHLRSVCRALERAGSRELLGAVEEYEHEIRASVPPVSEDSVISMLTNCVAARVSKRFGLRGPTMNVDQGLDSALVAVRLAIRALRTGDTDLVLVSGLSCGPWPEVSALLERLNPGLPTVAEGAFTLALTTERTATARHLDVLARLRPH